MTEMGTDPIESFDPHYDNVFLFGAGVSAAAGVPLLNPFLDRMWEYSVKKSANGTAISAEDLEILNKALSIKDNLESYNSRAHFNDRNIEDVLSLLSFEAFVGGEAK